VDFAPAGGLPPPPTKKSSSAEEELASTNDFVPFLGAGSRLNGKPIVESPSTTVCRQRAARGIPDFNWAPGNLTFIRKLQEKAQEKSKVNKDDDDKNKFTAFTGAGSTLNGGGGGK
jgi:hypothetical protein